MKEEPVRKTKKDVGFHEARGEDSLCTLEFYGERQAIHKRDYYYSPISLTARLIGVVGFFTALLTFLDQEDSHIFIKRELKCNSP